MFALPGRRLWASGLMLAVAFACSPHRRDEKSVVQEAGERGLKAIEQAEALQEGSRWQPPTEEASREAITTYESGRTEIQDLAILTRSRPDDTGTSAVAARVNGENRRYLLTRDDDGTWSVSPSQPQF